jgi:hypothetical protein
MAYLYRGEKCKEGNPEKCSKGKNSCPDGDFGGWICGCDESQIPTEVEINVETVSEIDSRLIKHSELYPMPSGTTLIMLNDDIILINPTKTELEIIEILNKTIRELSTSERECITQ